MSEILTCGSNTLLQLLKTEGACCVLAACYFFPFLLLSDDSFDVQVPGVEDDGVAAALELLLPLDLHAGSLLQS